MKETEPKSDPPPSTATGEIDAVRDAPATASSAAELRPVAAQLKFSSRRTRLRGADSAAAAKRARRPSSEGYGDSLDAGFEGELEILRSVLPQYQIIEHVEHGGQGSIYKAVQRATGRTVALKVLVDGPLASQRQRLRFEREVELNSRLTHPHIVRVYDSGTVRGRCYYTMEFIDGAPIDDYALLPDVTVKAKLELFSRVCRAVNFAHQNGVIHRDLNPSNILVDIDGQPHILDFGLARDSSMDSEGEGGQNLSMSAAVLGTLPYLSPEQAMGNSRRADTRSDTYALGVILFRLLTGEHPYPLDGETDDVRDRIISQMPASLLVVAGSAGLELPPGGSVRDIEAILRQALAKEPEARYQTAADFADDVQRYLDGDAINARGRSALYALRKAVRKHRWPATVAASFVTLLVVGLVTTSLLWRRAERIAARAQFALNMGGLLQKGSVLRDAGRLDQATAAFVNALEIFEEFPTDDPYLTRLAYDTHHRMAEMSRETGDTRNAEKHRDAAIEVGSKLLEISPRDRDWSRLGAFVDSMRGERAFADSQWALAKQFFGRAVDTRRQLLESGEPDPNIRSELAYALGWLGDCCTKSGEVERALENFKAGYDLRKELLKAAPEVADHAIDLCRSENMLAVWHLRDGTPESCDAARQYLASVRERLNELVARGLSDHRTRDVRALLAAVQKNSRILIEKEARLSVKAGPDHHAQ